MIKDYYQLTKPGIIRGNLFTAAAGLFLASKGHINLKLFVATLFGIGFVIAFACVINNYIDREIDKKMSRTKNRALVTGTISVRNALIFGVALGIIGFALLWFFTNLLVVILGGVAVFFYIVLYGYFKRHSVYGTLVGSVAGALPPAAAFLAVNDHGGAAVILFLILVFWQMPHFYSIAIYRHDDYAAAGLPVLPVKKTIKETKVHIVAYIIGFIVVSELLTIRGDSGYFYGTVAAIIGLMWLALALKNYNIKDSKLWAKKLFIFSLIVITVDCIAMSIDSFIH